MPPSEPERLAVLETEVRHMRESIDRMVKSMDHQQQQINVLLGMRSKAKGYIFGLVSAGIVTGLGVKEVLASISTLFRP